MRQLRQFVLFAALLVIPGAAFASAPQPDAGAMWQPCTNPGDWFCVVSATYDGNPMLVGGYDPDAGVILDAYLNDNNGFQSLGWNAAAPASYSFPSLSSNIQIVINTGDFHPAWGDAKADQFDVHVSGDADAGYVLTLQGTPTEANYDNALIASGGCTINGCGDQTTQADTYYRLFSGSIQTDKNGLNGLFVAANAQATSSPAVTSNGVFIQLANPHLGVDGGPTSGSYTAIVPPAYWTGIHTTVDAVLDGGIEVDRFDPDPDGGFDGGITLLDDGGIAGGTATPIAVVMTPEDVGVAGTSVRMRIDHLTYSSPKLLAHKKRSSSGTTGGTPPPTPKSGGGCASAGEAIPWAVLALVLVALAARSRRRSHD